ncbi:monocarboxylate transporter [Holotrichia oblita]|uniref:Monocarboxylate transporter n=1 Tax=Holotrichia oblita TaxID=644536 RepID=A0ACB9TA85_HOLOL|nr:monocarboxylate transporter [Holotrichia oblita]
MGLSSYPLALNSYFVKKRSMAAGYTMTICGLGPVLVPQLISFLLDTYGIKYSMVIMAALSANTFVSAVLLQPVEWHMKEEIVDDEAAKAEKDKLLEIEETDEDESSAIFNKRLAASMLSLKEELEIESKYGMDTPLAGSLLSLHPVPRSRKNTLTTTALPEESNSALETSAMITHVNEKTKETKYSNNDKMVNDNNMKVYDTNLSRKKKKKSSLMKRIGKSVVKLFDLTLLKDRIFVNIVVGMSLAVFAELNFSILTPFIMGDYHLSTHQIATFISVLSTADILFRFIAPYVSDFFKQPVRIMYMWALLLLILSRFSCAAFLGLAKGFRTVYWSLVIPNYVPIERLAAALGLYSTLNGTFIWIGGPFLAIGIGMGMSSYLLAINSYFNKNRSKATGLSMTIAGIGIILSPQLVSVLLENYTVRQTMLIVSAIAAHSFIAASLLQPVQWHAKTEVLPLEKKESDEDDKLLHENSIRNAEHPSKNTSTIKRFTKSIVNVLDLKLLKDPVFVNILVGLSIEYFSDFNFMWVIPFVLMEKGLSVDQTTTFISIYLIGDISSKCIAPFVAAILKRSSRVMLIGSIIGVVICRMYLPVLSVSDKTMLIAFALFTGAFRGLRLVYWFLTVPEYIPVERLASAFGLLHTLNGIFMIFGGPGLGLLRDKTGDYTACVILLNCLALYTVVTWIVEIVYIKMKGSQTLDDSSSQ